MAVYLDGRTEPEIATDVDPGNAKHTSEFTFGDRRPGSGASSFEGKLDEIAVYDRCVTPSEIAEHFGAAMGPVTASAP